MKRFCVHDMMLTPSVPVLVRVNGNKDRGSVQIEWNKLGKSPTVNRRTSSNVVGNEIA